MSREALLLQDQHFLFTPPQGAPILSCIRLPCGQSGLALCPGDWCPDPSSYHKQQGLTGPMVLLVHVPKVLVAQSYLILCDPMDCSPPGFSVHGILQARVLEWVAIPFSRGSSLLQGSNPGLPHCRQILYHLNHQGMSPSHPANLQVSQLLPKDSSWWEPERAGFRVQDRAKVEEGGGWGFTETSWGSRSWGAAEESTDWDRAAAVSTLHGAAGGIVHLGHEEQGLQEQVRGRPASWDRLCWVS